jgi:hypothetical protein
MIEEAIETRALAAVIPTIPQNVEAIRFIIRGSF